MKMKYILLIRGHGAMKMIKYNTMLYINNEYVKIETIRTIRTKFQN